MHRSNVRRRITTLLLPIGAIVMSSVATGFVSAAPASAAGILPPSNPSANIAPDNPDWLQSIDDARSKEGVSSMDISESALGALPFDQQVLTVVNDERVDRGEQPIQYVTAQLNAYAQGGANAGSDPSFPSTVTGGAPITFGGSVWAGGLTSGLEADYYWMYDDGYAGSATSNSACSLSNPSGCWGHRDIILHQFASCPSGPPILSMGAALSPSGYAGGSLAAIVVSTCSPPTDIAASWGQLATAVQSGSRTVAIAPTPNGTGYWEVEANGTVGAFGSAVNYGSLSGTLNAPIVGVTSTPDGKGYWLVGTDGGIFSFGDAAFYGSAGSLRLNKPIVGIATTPNGKGYWMVASDGGIFSFGNANFFGSMGGKALNRPIVGVADDPATGGYWEVASDGGIFSFNAPFYGSTGSIHLNQPIVGIEATPNGQGYRFVASDGGIFTYGQAPFDGSTGSLSLAAPVVGMAADNATNGYWMAAADGGVFTFGGATYFGRVVSAS